MRYDLTTLAFDLPEDINRAFHAGDFDTFSRLLDARLQSERTSPMMKKRLELEKELLPRRLRRYPYTRETAMKRMRERVPDFTEAELDAMETDGCVDYIYYGGEKRYVSSFSGTLIRMSKDLAAREVKQPEPDDGTNLDDFIADIKEKGFSAYRFRIKSSLKIEDDFFDPAKTYTVHIPVPARSAQQDESKIRVCADGYVSSPDACQRTVCFQRRSDTNLPFEMEIEYESRLKYVDPFRDVPRIVYPDVPAPCEDDLSEQYPHIAFTPYLRQLAAWIAGDEKRPLYLAKRVYDYITRNVRYSFMRTYFLIDRHAEYCALNMKGDCGLQAILFITLCRILGIPARWQSGWTVDKFSTGDHDWAMFWTAEFGWLFADPSYGGGAHRMGKEDRRQYYFGNLDCFRMVANSRYQSEFDPPKKHERFDPYDSQDGEVETETEGFDSNAFDRTDITQEFVKLDR